MGSYCYHCQLSVSDLFLNWASRRYRRRYMGRFTEYLIDLHEWLPVRGSGL